MIRFSAMTPAQRARLLGVLAVVPAGVLVSGLFVASSLAASGLPTPVITGSPSNPTTSSSATFTFIDSQARVTYRCSLDSSSFAACASGVTYTALAQGNHTFRVEAVSGSNTSTAASYTWQVGTTGPAAPVITSGPTNPSTDTSPEFIFTDADWPHVMFTCWLDSGKQMACTGDTDHDRNPMVEGEWQFSNLALGSHCFSVYATNGSPHTSPTTKFCWTIGTAAKNFAVGGSLTTPLYPGTSLPLNMTFTNPGSLPITIPSGGISASNITITSNAPGCASSNFAVAQGLTVAVTIPGNQTTPTSLSALGVPQADWPVIKMIETNTNQDACEGAKLTLTYSGIEASG
ncbi:MAG TPA: hypothetical protein VGS19_21325 [Streptosporangiaceae bacterium]|nr:hypothetical protein [Streptosporangiaceae bacterium]